MDEHKAKMLELNRARYASESKRIDQVIARLARDLKFVNGTFVGTRIPKPGITSILIGAYFMYRMFRK